MGLVDRCSIDQMSLPLRSCERTHTSRARATPLPLTDLIGEVEVEPALAVARDAPDKPKRERVRMNKPAGGSIGEAAVPKPPFGDRGRRGLGPAALARSRG